MGGADCEPKRDRLRRGMIRISISLSQSANASSLDRHLERLDPSILGAPNILLINVTPSIDYGESHYIGPIGADQPNSQAWTTGFDHQHYLGVTEYYATAWKTGVYPAITQPKIFLTARPHSKNAVCTSDSVAQPSNAQWVRVWTGLHVIPDRD